MYWVLKGSKMGHETNEINISRISLPCAHQRPWPVWLWGCFPINPRRLRPNGI